MRSTTLHCLVIALLVAGGCDNGGEPPSGSAPNEPRMTASAGEQPLDRREDSASSVDGDGAQAPEESSILGRLTGETRLTRVRFLSLRNKTGSAEPAQTFGDERDVIRAGRCEVTFTPIRILDNIARDAPLYIPSDDQEIVAVNEIPMQTFWDDYVAANAGKRPLLYVHGYNIGFDKGCFRAARFIENLDLGDRVLLFSWPSDGSTLNYVRDEADLHWSVKAMREVITRMEILFGPGNFDIIAHSLGARGVSLALSTLQGFHDDYRPLVDKLVLVAADIDAQIFEQILPRLRSQVRHITAYVSDNDNALAVSRELHGYPRLGESSSHVVTLEEVEVIDVSELSIRRVSGHLYHLYNEAAFIDIDELLNGRLPAVDRSRPKRIDPTVPNYWRLPVPPETDPTGDER